MKLLGLHFDSLLGSVRVIVFATTMVMRQIKFDSEIMVLSLLEIY